jgi:hypothetical protein
VSDVAIDVIVEAVKNGANRLTRIVGACGLVSPHDDRFMERTLQRLKDSGALCYDSTDGWYIPGQKSPAKRARGGW